MRRILQLVCFFMLGCAAFQPRSELIPRPILVQLQTARQAIAAGDYDAAQQILDGLKQRKDNQKAVTEQIQSMNEFLLSSKITNKVGQASTLSVEPNEITAGEAVKITITLRNPFPEPVRLEPADELNEIMGRLRAFSLEWDAYGNSTRNDDITPFQISQTIEIAGGGEWQQVSYIPIPALNQFALRDYRLTCEFLQMNAVHQNEETVLNGLKIGPAVFQAFPAGFQQIKEQPVEALTKALEKSEGAFDRHIVIAAYMIARANVLEDKNKAIRLCMLALSYEPKPHDVPVMTALNWLTGNKYAVDKKRPWFDWWKDHQSEYEEKTAN